MDQKAPPHVKLADRERLAVEEGKEFDERKERQVMGLPMPEGRDPIFIPASKKRLNETRRLDAQQRAEEEEAIARGKAALEEDSKRALDSDKDDRMAKLEADNAKLQAQIRELMGDKDAGIEPEKPAPVAKDRRAVLPEGEPNESWSMTQLKEYNRVNGFEPFEKRGGIGMTKFQILEHVLGQIEKRKAGGDGE